MKPSFFPAKDLAYIILTIIALIIYNKFINKQ